MYQVSVDLGSGWEDVSSKLLDRRPVQRTKALHAPDDPCKPVIGTARFTLARDTTLINRFLTATEDVKVAILYYGAPYFGGTIRRTHKVRVGRMRVEGFEVECVDAWYRLEKTCTLSATWANYSICNPAAKSTSILHQLFYAAGFADAEIDLQIIAGTISRVVFDSSRRRTYRAIIEEILRDTVFTARVGPDGVVQLYDMAPAAIPTSKTLSSGAAGNIAEGYELERNEAKAEAVEVSYWPHITHPNGAETVIFEETTGGSLVSPCNIPLATDGYHPAGASASKDVRAEFKVRDYELVAVDSPVLDWAGSGVVSQVAAVDGLAMRLRFYSAAGGAITKLRIKGNAIVKGSLGKVIRENVASTERRESIEAAWITTEPAASRLAIARANWHRDSAYTWVFPEVGDLSIAPGDLVQLTEASLLGAAQILRVVSVQDGHDAKSVRITCEGASAYTYAALPTQSTAGNPAPNDPPSIGGVPVVIIADTTPPTVPGTPSVSQLSTGALRIAFAGSSDLESGVSYYNLYRRKQGGASWAAVLTTKHDARAEPYQADDTSAIPGETYEYAVAGVDQRGNESAMTAPSAPITAEIADPTISNALIVDGALRRAAIEAGFVAEHAQIALELFPYGLAQPSELDILRPNSYEASALVEQLMDVVANAEEGINVAMRVVDGNTTRIASLQFDLDGLRSMVGELLEGTGGQTIDLTLISQTAEKVRTMALSGTYVEGGQTLSTWEKGQIDVLKDQIALVVESAQGGGWQIAQSIITESEIASKVVDAIENDAGVQAGISEIVQQSDAIAMRVRELESETLERIDEALATAQAGILVTSRRIELAVQAQGAENEALQAAIVLEADRITQEVSRAAAAEGELSTQIIQTAEAIHMAVWGSPTPGDSIPTLASSIALNAESVAAMVEGGGSGAFLSLSVTLPTTITAGQRAQMVGPATEAEVAAVYGLTTGGFYAIRPAASIEQIKALKGKLRVAGMLGSQIVLDADEILMGGKIRAKDLEVEGIDATGAITARALHMDPDPQSTTDFEAHIDATGVVVRKGSNVILSIDPETGEARFSGEIDAASGTFRGSIESGPMILNKQPPASTSHNLTGKVYAFVEAVRSATGLLGGSFACTGNYGGDTLSRLEFSRSALQSSTYSYNQKTGTHQESYQTWGLVGWDFEKNKPIYGWITNYVTYDDWREWTRIPPKYSYSVKLYNTAGTLIADLSDTREEAGTWALSGTTGAAISPSGIPADAPAAPSATGGTLDFPSTGTLSLTAGAFTMRFIGLPSGFSSDYALGTVYTDENGFMKVKR